MAVQLLPSKLNIPISNSGLVERAALLAQLKQSSQYKLVLLSTPAGFGKTTLLSQWAITHPNQYSWFSLDESDNNPVQFWAYFEAAFQNGLPPSFKSLDNVKEVPNSLISRLSACPTPFSLILDNYQTITNPQIHSNLAFLIENLPKDINLMLASRADPPLPVARWRAKGQLLELRGYDLRFSLDETTTLIKQSSQLQLSQEEINTLQERSEGWITGLHLAILSLQRRNSRINLLDTLKGSHRYILDYLGQEVLDSLSENDQTFLMQTAILDKLNANLCQRLTGRKDSQALLEKIESSNLCIVPLDEYRHWYRYHHLFADFLRERLQRDYSDQIPDLHRKAYEACLANQLLPEAIKHALACGEHELAAKIIEQLPRIGYPSQELKLRHSWFVQLPEPLIKSSPILCLANSWVFINLRQWERAQRWLEQARLAPDDLQLEVTAIEVIIAALQGNSLHAIAIAESLIPRLDEVETAAASLVHLNLANAYRQIGNNPKAQEFFQTAGEATDFPEIALAALNNLGQMQIGQAQIEEAHQTYQNMLNLATCQPTENSPLFMALAQIALAEILRRQEAWLVAHQYLDSGLSFARELARPELIINGLLIRAKIFKAQGDLEQALSLLVEIADLAKDDLGVLNELEAFRVELQTNISKISPSLPPPLFEPLTPRQQELLQLVAQGKSNQAIAEELILSLNTVKSYLKNLFDRLEVVNRTEAVAKARQRGLLS